MRKSDTKKQSLENEKERLQEKFPSKKATAKKKSSNMKRENRERREKKQGGTVR